MISHLSSSATRQWMALFALLLLVPFASARPGADQIASAESHYTQVDGIRVHYKLIGESGPVILFVHGGGCDLTFWELQVTALAQSLSLIHI